MYKLCITIRKSPIQITVPFEEKLPCAFSIPAINMFLIEALACFTLVRACIHCVLVKSQCVCVCMCFCTCVFKQ